MCVWTFAHRKARQGEWDRIVFDRSRFQRRISLIEPLLTKILERKLNIINNSKNLD